MKKFALSALVLAMALPAHADVLALKAGVDAWAVDSKTNDVYGGDDTAGSYYVAFEHFIPLIPNVRLRQTSVETSALAFDMTDVTAYYEMLDNDLIAFDLGLTLTNYSNGRFRAQQFDEWEPSIYGNVKIGVPATNFGLFTELNFGSFTDSSVVDAQAGLEYTIGLVAADVNLRAGYRVIDNDFGFVAGDGKAWADGAFAGVEVHF
uniref:TIGR04219 family outer membrane beta-barrel protein n=1 Tax=Thaumasiovibrio occultus TaxID=1891184 RepID=UPI000B35DE5B|nr:TIGR04219 family outer membrane beta-barrel protein [Thaumasiovibrio occultus]